MAKNILESNDWDLERAVHNFMGYGDLREQNIRRRNVEVPTVRFQSFLTSLSRSMFHSHEYIQLLKTILGIARLSLFFLPLSDGL